MLLFLFTKVSCLPLVSDFTEPALVEKLGINNEQAKTIQGLNSELIYIHGLLQKYILTQFTTALVCKKILDKQIDNLPQADMSYLLNFLKNYQDVKSVGMQKGGMNLWNIASTTAYVGSFFSGWDKNLTIPGDQQEVTRTTPSQSAYQVALEDPSIRVFSTGIMSSSIEDLRELVQNVSRPTGQTSISGIIQTIDDKSWLPSSGKTEVENFIKIWNTGYSSVSKQAIDTCADLIEELNKKGIFQNYRYLDSELDVIESIDEAKYQFKQEQEQETKINEENKVPPQPQTDDGSWTSYYNSIRDYIPSFTITQTTKATDQQIIKRSQPQDYFDPTTKERFSRNIASAGKLFCISSYNLKIVLTDDSKIQIIGDKIPYDFMEHSIDGLLYNINLEMKRTSKEDVSYLAIAKYFRKIDYIANNIKTNR